jgi:integrase
MSVQQRKDTGRWRFKIALKLGQQRIVVRKTLPKNISERRARQMDKALIAAVKYFDFRYLDEVSRRVCIDIYRDYDWALPPALIESSGNQGSAQETTLLEAIKFTISDPEVKKVKDPDRYMYAFDHIQAYWTGDYPVAEITARQIREYMLERKNAGASGSTINKERQALSKMFRLLIQERVVDRNPIEDTKPADERPGERDVFISCDDFIKVVDRCTSWSQPIFEMLYLTGMRRGEVLGLTWNKVNLEKRIITLDYSDTKERRDKRIPIHKILVRILHEVQQARSPINGRVFLNPDGDTPHEDSLTRCWRTAVKAVGFDPKPTVHDLRHCWFTNAMRSGVPGYIADAIVGHGDKKKSLQALYMNISDKQLLDAVDMMKFDVGETDIRVRK